MGYKTINVCLNDIAVNEKLLEAVASLASTFDAHINGVYIIPAPQFYPTNGVDIMPIVIDTNQVYFREHSKKVRETFGARMQRDNLAHSFIEIESDLPTMANEMIGASEVADLVVCVTIDEKAAVGIESDFIELLLTSLGRLILILPRHYDKKLSFNEIIVGWNGSREAARATFDAMPILKLASNVHVTIVDPQKIEGLRGKVAGVDIAETLARHKVKAIADNYSTNGEEPGVALIEHASEVGAGLIVVGAYGHSRLREYILGGVTRTMLSELDRPVFMSH